MDVIHSPLEENITNLQPSYRQHISRAVLEAVCFQVMLSSKNIVRVLSILIWISLEIFFKLDLERIKNCDHPIMSNNLKTRRKRKD